MSIPAFISVQCLDCVQHANSSKCYERRGIRRLSRNPGARFHFGSGVRLFTLFWGGRDSSRQSGAGSSRPLYGRAMWAGIVLVALVGGDHAADAQVQGLPCPGPADVDAELVRVGAIGVAPPVIEVIGDRMRVALRGLDGSSIGSREVEAPQTCHERATVAAVFVATWMGIWPKAPEGTRAPATAAAREPSQAVVEKPAPPPPSRPAEVTSDAHPPAALEGRRSTEIGLALQGGHDGNAAALGIAIEARRPLVGPLLAWVGIRATTERDRTVGPAVGGYSRPAMEIGPALRLGHGRVQADLAAAGRLGILIVRGRDLPVAHVKAHVVPGAAAEARLVLAGKRLSPFAAVAAGYWFGQQQLTLDHSAAKSDLPRWDVEAGLGIFWAP